jgi:hypothetical protein
VLRPRAEIATNFALLAIDFTHVRDPVEQQQGHVWTDFEFVENHARLDINALHRVGALIAGAET